MTTFTMQDLNNLPTTPEEDEAMEALAKLGGGVDLKEMFVAMNPTPNPEPIQYTQGGTLGAPEPQPSTTPTGTSVPTIESVIDAISSQLRLLATVISQSQAQGNSLNVEDQSLQECVGLVLKQSDWFKDLVRQELIGGGIEDLAKDAVQEVVENEVESYFENNFDPAYHFDFDDAVHDAVGDRIDDVVADKIDDALDSYMQNATITINK